MMRTVLYSLAGPASVARRAAVRIALAVLIVAGLLGSARAADQVLLQDSQDSVRIWSSVSVLFDAQKSQSIQDVLATPEKFVQPSGSYETLGVRTEAAWLRVPLKVDARSDGNWILDINYPPIKLIDVFVVSQGTVIQQAQLGSMRPFETRPLLSRTHAVTLRLQPGGEYLLFIRAESRGSLILPITLNKADAFHVAAVQEQMLQGLLNGLGLCLLLYSLLQWFSLREPLFLKFCVLVSGSLLFSLLQFGIGAQFLWTNNFWMEQHAAGISSLLALCGSFLFIEQALVEPGSSRTFSRLMKGGAALCGVLGVVYCLDLFDTRVLTAIITVMGPIPSIMGIPGAVGRMRRGDSVGLALLLAWLVYLVTTAIITGVIRGQIPVNFWTMHSFQFGATFDMIAFMYVLGQRTKAIRLVAQRASVERDLMRSLAITDPLTGLANRRGLHDALTDSLTRASSTNLVAVYMIDVDGFKQVNDRHGHDTGDELLVNITHRLRATMRGRDVVARLGGDEFVVVAEGLQTVQQAHELGQKLIAAFDASFTLKQHTMQVGLTIGFAVAPLDARDTATILRLADIAMYEGKQAGKHCLRRTGTLRTSVATGAAQAV